MKLALVYEKFISRGGLENYLYSLANQLVTDGHYLEIITGETDEKTEALPRAKFHITSRNSLSEFSTGAETTLSKIDSDISIGFGRTVSHDLHRAGGGCHKFYSEQILHPLKRASKKNRTELALERELYTSGKTRHFVVNSQMVAEQLQQAYELDPDRISVIHTAVDSDQFRPADSPADRQLIRGDLPASTPVFLFVSMNHRRKGLDALLKAWTQAPSEAQLWIVGPPLARRYRKAINKANIGSQVREFIQPDNLPQIYQAADFFIHPTLYDACANTVLQSMASGLPGIISECDGAKQFIKEGENGTLLPHPSDPDEIAAKIGQMCELSPDERTRMGASARETVLPLTWAAHVIRWMEVIQQLK